MSFLILSALSFVLAFWVYRLIFARASRPKNLPPGSLGFPLLGETLSFLLAFRKGGGEEWINKRVEKYGPVFKTSLMGSPTMVVVGLEANKFSFGAPEDLLDAQLPKSATEIIGEYSVIALTGERYKLIKGAMVSFLKPESLQNYIKQMDNMVTSLLLEETKERNTIATVMFMKKLMLNIGLSILFGIKDELTWDTLFVDFIIAGKGIWSMPLNFPGTDFRRGMQARSRIIKLFLPLIKKRKEELSAGLLTPKSDFISCLLALEVENQETITGEMILDNIIALTISSQDNSAHLLSLMVRRLSSDAQVYQKVVQEQIQILREREGREDKNLTWVDIQKMKYTWRVALELMRLMPPVFATSRKALQHTSFGGYDIPKGWKVFTTAHGTHMNKDIFENPKEFDPSRFDKSVKQIPPYGYVAFGAGLHSCIGNEFARCETLTTIHRLVTMYEWKQVDPNESITHYPIPRFLIQVKARVPS